MSFFHVIKIPSLLLVALAFAVNTYAEGRVVVQAYEVLLEDFQAPTTRIGTATFRTCPSCDKLSVSTTASTRYSINGVGVQLDEFRRTITQAESGNDNCVTVLHHLESDSIEAIDATLLR